MSKPIYGDTVGAGGGGGVRNIPQSDWKQTDATKLDYIKNKPDMLDYATIEWVKAYVLSLLSDDVKYSVSENGTGYTYTIIAQNYRTESNEDGNTIII